MHTCVRWLHFFFVGVCDVLQLVGCDVYSVVSHGHSSPYSTMVTRHFVCTTPRRGGLRFGTRQDNFVPSGRFREDGLEACFKAANGGEGARVNTLGAPPVAKRTKPINGDSLQVQVEPVVPTP